jgi:hypothetical protein
VSKALNVNGRYPWSEVYRSSGSSKYLFGAEAPYEHLKLGVRKAQS